MGQDMTPPHSPPPVPPAQPPRRQAGRLVRTGRRLAMILGATVSAAVLLAGIGGMVGATWISGAAGNAWITAQAARAVPGLRLDGVDGLPFHPRIRHLTLADTGRPDRPWLVADGLAVDASPGPLLRGLLLHRVVLDAASIQRLWLDQSLPADDENSDDGILPTLPVAVTLRQLTLPRVELTPALLGLPPDPRTGDSALALNASADLAGDLSGHLTATAHGLDGLGDTVSLDATFAPPNWHSAGHLTLALTAGEESGKGGLLARMLEGSDLTPQTPDRVTLDLRGDGPLNHWQGHVTATAAAMDISADATVSHSKAILGAGAADWRLQLASRAHVAPLLPASVRPLAGDAPLALDADLTRHGDGRVSVASLTLDMAALKLTAAGSLSPAFNGGDLTARLTPSHPDSLAPLLPGISLDGADIRLEAAPAKPVDPAQRPMAQRPVMVKATVAVQGLRDAAMPTLSGDTLRLSLAGRIDASGESGEIEHLDLSSTSRRAGGGGVETALSGSGRFSDGGRTAEAALAAKDWDLGALSGLLGLPGAAGRLSLSAALRLQDGQGDGEASLHLGALRTGTPAGDALTAGGLDAQTRLRFDEVQGHPRLTVDSLDLRTGALTAKAAGSWSDGNAQGHLSGTGVIDGRPVRLDTTVRQSGQGVEVDALTLALGPDQISGQVHGDLKRRQAQGRITATLPDLGALAALMGQPLAGHADAALTLTPAADGQQADLTVDAGGVSITPGQGNPPQRVAALHLSAQISDLLGQPRATAQATATGVSGGALTLDHLSLAAQGTENAGTAHVALDGRMVRAHGTLPALPLRMDASGAWLPPVPITPIAPPRRKGKANTPAARIPAGVTLAVRLDHLNGQIGGIPLTLTAPATVSTGRDDGIHLDQLRLTAGGGQLDGQLDLDPGTLAARLTATALPLGLLALADPSLDINGTADATLTAGGSRADPEASVQVALHGVSLRGLLASGSSATAGELALSKKGAPASATLAATVAATLRHGAIDGSGSVTASDQSLALDGRLTTSLPPGLLTGAPPSPLVATPSPALTARLSGHADLGRFNDLVAATGQRLGGKLTTDLTIAGTQNHPQITGTIDLTDGRFENGGTGTLITALDAHLTGDAQGLTIDHFKGATPDGGSVTLQGRLLLAPGGSGEGAGPSADLRLLTDNARLVRTDPVTAWVDSDLTLRGPLSHPKVAGTVGLRRTWVGLPDKMPADVADLPVRETNGGRPRAADAPPPASPGTVADLDIHVTAANQIYAQGRGLTSEFKADLKITGTSDAPHIVGPLSLVKGDLSALGQTFTLNTADITFTGDTDPQLNVSASATKSDFTAIMTVTGRTSAPKVAFTSDPVSPQDEVLSRLLFDKNLGQLSALEALQLANSAAQMSGILGSGPGFMDKVKQTLGVDRLEFSGNSATTGTSSSSGSSTTTQGLGTISAGRYINDRTYLGVSQGLGSNQTNVTLEYELTKGLRINGAVGTDESVGIKYQWDY